MSPHVADGESLQIWMVDANIRRLGQPTRDSSPVWGLGGRLAISHRKKAARYEMLQNVSKRILVNTLINKLLVP
jgi:hypothetical protein